MPNLYLNLGQKDVLHCAGCFKLCLHAVKGLTALGNPRLKIKRLGDDLINRLTRIFYFIFSEYSMFSQRGWLFGRF